MRARTFLMTASLALVALSLPPAASAFPCPPPQLGFDDDHPASLIHSETDKNCTNHVYVLDPDCAEGEDDWNYVPLWAINPIYIHYNLCSDPDRGLLDDPVGDVYDAATNPPAA